MLNKILSLAFMAAFALLLMSSEARAWGGYQPGNQYGPAGGNSRSMFGGPGPARLNVNPINPAGSAPPAGYQTGYYTGGFGAVPGFGAVLLGPGVYRLR